MFSLLAEGAVTNTSLASVGSTIASAATDLGAQALPVITAAVGLGIIFWGAKTLWNKFKGMAK